MDHIDEHLVETVDRYIESLFVPADPGLRQALQQIAAAGMPTISVSPTEGKLLYLLTKISGATRVLEIGTLGGYSTIWMARALPSSGKIITLEISPQHAEVARQNLARCSVAGRVEIRIGSAAELLRGMISAGEPAFDLVFIDADKTAYVEYLNLSLQLSRPGTLILADNVIRNGRVIEHSPSDPNAMGARAYNDAIAAHPRLESLILPIYREKLDGLSISIVR